jgi:hypothetical protein
MVVHHLMWHPSRCDLVGKSTAGWIPSMPPDMRAETEREVDKAAAGVAAAIERTVDHGTH